MIYFKGLEVRNTAAFYLFMPKWPFTQARLAVKSAKNHDFGLCEDLSRFIQVSIPPILFLRILLRTLGVRMVFVGSLSTFLCLNMPPSRA